MIPEKWPQFALGWNDVGGENGILESEYGVVSHTWHSLSESIGYVRRTKSQCEEGYQGVFGGVEWQITPLGLSLLAEHDGRTLYGGSRWQSPPLEPLGGIQIGATIQHVGGATFSGGGDADALSGSVNLVWPIAYLDERRKNFKTSRRSIDNGSKKPAPNVQITESATQDSTPLFSPAPRTVDALTPLRQRLEQAGLERVRVGTRGDSAHLEVIVEYENHRPWPKSLVWGPDVAQRFHRKIPFLRLGRAR